MHVHAVIDAARYQAASQPATAKEERELIQWFQEAITNNSPEQGNQKSRQIGNHSGLGARGRLNLGVTRWTDHVCRRAAYGNQRGHNCCVSGCGRHNGCVWAHGLHAAYRLLVGWRRRRWRYIGELRRSTARLTHYARLRLAIAKCTWRLS